MKFKIEDIKIEPRSLGIFGTGQLYRVKHIPSGITLENKNEKRLLTRKEKNDMLEELKRKVEATPPQFELLHDLPVKETKNFAQVSMEDKIRSMSRLYKLAKMAIKEDKIVKWMTTPSKMLKGMTPFEACLTDKGYDRVEAILAGIVYGIPS